jgi:endo-1,4-beta-xylanase
MLRREMFAMAASASAAIFTEPARASGISLRDCAAAHNICFGSEVTTADLAADPAYAELIAQECAIITPGIEAKWPYIEPAEGSFTFGPMDTLMAFARQRHLRLHMHNLIWSVGLPPWTLAAIAAGRGAAIMARHISSIVRRYQDNVDSWDVINEPADPRWPSGPEGLCRTPWRNGLGPSYVAQALREASAANPRICLMINDDDLEYEGIDRDKKREIYVRLIEALRRNDVPLHGFGLEAHLKPWRKIADARYRRFLSELAAMDLAIYVTELDVCDREMPSDVIKRDMVVAEITKNYLDIVLDEPATSTVITWGLSDRTTWMLHDPAARRRDGLVNRPLPYDAHLQPKPMRRAMIAAFSHARDRPLAKRPT